MPQLSSGKSVELRGLWVEAPPTTSFGLDPNFDYTAGISLHDSEGVTWVENCIAVGFFESVRISFAPEDLTRVGATAQTSGFLSPFGASAETALAADGSRLAIDRCEFVGGVGSNSFRR